MKKATSTYNPMMAGIPTQRRAGFTMQHAYQEEEGRQGGGGFMSRFLGGARPPQNQQQQAQEAAAKEGAVANEGQPTNPQQNSGGQSPTGQEGTPPASTDSLDIFKGLFDNEGNEGAEAPPSFTLSSDTLSEVANGLDFSSGLKAEDLQAVQNGDTEALMRVIQHVGRQSYMNALQHGSQLTDQFVNARSEFDRKGVAPAVKEQLLGQEMEQGFSKEAWSNPVVKGQLIDIAKRLHRVHPDASTKWIAEQSKQYLTQITAQALGLDTASLSDPNGARQQKEPAGEIDWEKELGV